MSDASDTSPRSRLLRLGQRLIQSRHALWGLTLASFLESTVVPIPLEALLIPMMQARRRQMFLFALLALLGCLAGVALGYAAGLWLFGVAGDQLIAWFSTPEQFERARQAMESRGFWFVLSVGVTPVPFQTAMLVSGATGFSFGLFMLASALARGLRYFGLALLVYWAGDQAEALFRRHTRWVSAVLLVAFVLVLWLS
ncbi:MAG: alkaline phosphatase [Haliea sp.]|nr:alkaline phosphatase [Haliea sp.]